VGVTNSKEVWDGDIRERGIETRDMQTEYESENPYTTDIYTLCDGT
jgi:hypothetical protein